MTSDQHDAPGSATPSAADSAAAARKPRPRQRHLARWISLGAGVLLVVAMFLSTKFVDPNSAGAQGAKQFNAKEFVAAEFPKVVASFTKEAVDMTQLVPALEKDPKAAATEFKAVSGTGKDTYKVTVTATVKEVDANFAVLDTPDLGKAVIRIPVGVALNGTPVRDAAGMQFADFVDQTAYQSVANEFKLAMQSQVLQKADLKSLVGKTITVVGAYAVGGPPNSYIIQPVSIVEAG